MIISCTLNLSYSQAIHIHVATRSFTHLSITIKQNNVAPPEHQCLTYSDPVDKADILNRQSESVFSKLHPLSLKQLAKQATASICTPNMQIIDISIEGVDTLLQVLSPNKASGPDEISPKILKIYTMK